jgi:hypothetical protein
MLKTKRLIIPLMIAPCAGASAIYGSTLQGESDTLSEYHWEYVKARTVPSGYFRVSVSPGATSNSFGDRVEIGCNIGSLVNTPVEIRSIEVNVFNFYNSLISEQTTAMDFTWSASAVYAVVGDEACYRLRVNFTTPYAEPGEYSEFTADSFPIAAN